MKAFLLIVLIFAFFLSSCDRMNGFTPFEVNNEPVSVKPVTRDDNGWWMKRHMQKLQSLKNIKTVDLLMIGDSITHEWENTGKNIWKQYYSQRNAFNLGYNGDRTEHVIWRLQHGEVDNLNPKLIMMMIGTNNTGQERRDKAELTIAGIKAILNELRTRLPNTKILLLAIFPRQASAEDDLRIENEKINDVIKNYADNKYIFFLNINNHFLEKDATLSNKVMPDLLHPGETGYRIWAEAVEPTIKILMK